MKNFIYTIFFLSTFSSCVPNDLEYIQEISKENKTKKKSLHNISLNNWMINLPNETNITQISIPGTHDSGARYDPAGGIFTMNTAKTQNLSIDEQLKIGVRFLDIRCKIQRNKFGIYHGPIFQNLIFENVILSIKNFLTANPSECIILSIKKEDITDSDTKFDEIFKKYMEDIDNILYKNNNIFPLLGQVRGKVILIKRFSSSLNVGYDASSGWINNYQGNFIINKNTYSFNIQDYYNVSNLDNKWSLIENQLLRSASSSNPNIMYFNFFSGIKTTFFIPNIKNVSDFINFKAMGYFIQSDKKNYGICIVDFAKEAYTKSILNINFK